jgi:hypothetical protein
MQEKGFLSWFSLLNFFSDTVRYAFRTFSPIPDLPQKSNTYEVRTYYKDWTGVRKQKTKRGFKRKCDAQEWERAFKLKENLSLDMYFEDFVDLYLNDIKSRIKYNTWLTKKHIVEKKILPYFSKKKLQEIKPSDIRQWQNTMMNYRNRNIDMIAADEDRLERVRDNIDAAENEYAKYADMITDKKNKLEMLTSKENELVERTKIAENVYDMFRHGGDDDVREKLIDVMYENQRLQEENKSLKELLEKAYEFMKQFVIDGVNLLEKFMESVGKVMERLR